MHSHEVVIVAHLARASHASRLADATGAEYITLDDGSLGCEGNHLCALRYHYTHPGARWAVVLEDDAVPVSNFTEQLTDALNAAPTLIASLYLGRGRPPQHQGRIERAVTAAKTEDAHWIVDRRLLHGVGYAIHHTLLPSLMAYHSSLPIDQHISDWARHHSQPVAYMQPSLVDHADDLPTLANHPDREPRNGGRHAWTHGAREEWAARFITMSSR